MDWTANQGEILTGGGRLQKCWKDFDEKELPHYHKQKGDCLSVFRSWAKEKKDLEHQKLINGSWGRTIFVGGWSYSDEKSGEDVFNVQTSTLFVDIRIPHCPTLSHHKGFESMTLEELRLFARRHAFGGFGVIDGSSPSSPSSPSSSVCVRHHWIDWNFIGPMRPRPNKWRIELKDDGQMFKEWGFAKDSFGQTLYMELWYRFAQEMQQKRVLSMCRRTGVPAILVIYGNHFNYLRDREVPNDMKEIGLSKNLIQLVDDAAQKQEREKIIKYLSLTAHHGQIVSDPKSKNSQPWTITRSLHPWTEGKPLFSRGDVSVLPERKGENPLVLFEGEEWEILESSISISELRVLFLCSSSL